MPLQQGDIKTLDVLPDTAELVDGQIVRTTTATFTVRGNGPFRVSIPTKSLSRDALTAQMVPTAQQVVTVLESVPEVVRVIPGVSQVTGAPYQPTIDCEFMVNGRGPYTVSVPLRNWTAEALVQQALTRREDILHTLAFSG